ncbi:Dus-domain-containing protein [Microstroma glucosiphilum]|uniref:tRNA-dihydrouridine(16/17) synthase [NAD(P)(+)] n=1 Tax=Pseudomicrostroma glucosiphilum TaxID=1684307 RepID=A0A316U7H0_9BASI|nr:Dus-domain-containing protein [Pseudomicrostroma glucosiphilum]PWN21132.1 Dus-domain-containing protein [Pseudomicrostroma glucosiphilum]
MPSRTNDDVASSSSSSSSVAGPSKASGSTLPPILPLSAFPNPGTPIHEKPSGYTFYKEVLNSSKYIVAPMVSASELPWRTLSRRYGADLCYSPMINCRSLVDSLHGKSKNSRAKALEWFDVDLGEEGSGEDKMLVVQLAGSDPKIILEAAEHVQDHCLAVDLNLGCPQHIAKRGHYGSYLQEDWPLIFNIINTLHLNLRIPVTAKMRVFDDVERTVAYAKMLQHAGAQIVTVHGRTREQKGHKTGVADWEKIRAVKQALDVPVFANGNILYGEDLQSALDKTGADGVMSAEGNLYNPTIFSTSDLREKLPTHLFPHRTDGPEPNPEWAPFPYIPAIAHAYLDEVVQCKTRTEPGAVKGHIFKICRPALERHTDIRANIGKAKLLHLEEGQDRGVVVKEYREAMDLLDERLMVDRKDSTFSSAPTGTSKHIPPSEQRYLPHWLCQPYFRPPLAEPAAEAKQAKGVKEVGATGAASGDGTAGAGAVPVKSNGMVDPADVQTEGEKRVMMDENEEADQGGNDAKRIRVR